MPPHHAQEHLEGERVDLTRHRVRAHDLGHLHTRVDAGGEHPGAQVPVGEDARQPLAVQDEERGDAVVRHDPCRIGRRRGPVDSHRPAAQEVADPGLEDGVAVRGQLERVHRAAQRPRPLSVEERVDLRMLGTQEAEVRLGKDQGEAVLDRRDVERRRSAPRDSHRPEAPSGTTAVDEVALGVVDLGRTRAQDEQPVVIVAPGDERGAASEVLDGHHRREPVQHRRGKGVERFVLCQELPDLRELDVEGHGPIVTVRSEDAHVQQSCAPSVGDRSTDGAVARRQSPARSVRLLE